MKSNNSSMQLYAILLIAISNTCVFVEAQTVWNNDSSWQQPYSSWTSMNGVKDQSNKPQTPWFVPAPLPIITSSTRPQKEQPATSSFFRAPARRPPTTTRPQAMFSSATSSTISPRSTWRINFGADTPYTDTKGNVWEPDTNYIKTNDGMKVNKCGNNPFPTLPDKTLFCTYRDWIRSRTTGKLSFPVSNGTYKIDLLLTEPSANVGQRVVDVYVQGNKIWSGVDVASLVSNTVGVYTLSVQKPVTTGAVEIEIRAQGNGRPILAGIEIVPAYRRMLRHSTATTMGSVIRD